jgi:hypothetical protein
MTANLFHIELGSDDLHQILDGLEIRAEAWERTETYLLTGYAPDDFIVEECSNADEAHQIAAQYRSIIAKIRNQL